MKKGMMLLALQSSKLDKVTMGKLYEVRQVVEGKHNRHFTIVNDEGYVSMPVAVSFKPVETLEAVGV